MDLADAKICKTLIINIVYFADSLNSYQYKPAFMFFLWQDVYLNI